jgi:hypothetical protein
MISTRLLPAALWAAMAAANLTLGAGNASAHKPRTCPDGTVVSDSRRCPPKSLTPNAAVQHSKSPAGFGRTILNPNTNNRGSPPQRPK